MFFGFKSLSLFQGNFLYFNGLRIVMKPPSHPSKLGVYIEVNVKEYEHYTVSNVFNERAWIGAPPGQSEPEQGRLPILRAPHLPDDE
jgi:hypothetical protein